MAYKKIVIAFAVVAILAIAGVIGWQRYFVLKPEVSIKTYEVGLLQMASIVSQNMDGFKAGMEELGYKEGVNVNYTYRDAEGDLGKLNNYALELVAMKPDMIFVNTSPATLVIKNATENTDIPVVFSMVADPLGAGFVKSVKSSGNNLTGTSCAYIDVAAKRLEVLTETFPGAKRILMFYRPEDQSGGACAQNIMAKAPELDVEILAYAIEKKEDIVNYLNTLSPGDIDAIMDPGDSMVSQQINALVEQSLRLKAPYFGLSKGEVEAGAVAGYAVDYHDLGKQSALIANQVLRGIDPSDIPFEQPRLWYFALNLESAEKIGVNIPDEVIQKADLVIN